MRLPLVTRRAWIRLGVLFGTLGILSVGSYSCMVLMPGRSHSGPLPPLAPEESRLAATLRGDVETLAVRIGQRNHFFYDSLAAATDHVEKRLGETGLPVARHTYEIKGKPFHNLEAERKGSSKPEEIVIVGAHYDSVLDCPGANDNGSGAAALLALAGALAAHRPARTLRWVAFTNEEPPHFQTETMGSRVYARRCRERNENIVAMLSLETIGCYSDAEKSQAYPPPMSLFYPSRGNFITFVGNLGSRRLVREVVGSFRRHAAFPSEGAALPGWLTGVGWSDQWSFWEEGYPGVMVTDTAPFRYPHYHTPEDTPDKIDFERCARVVAGLEKVIRDLAGMP